jgi:hypothetical protein
VLYDTQIDNSTFTTVKSPRNITDTIYQKNVNIVVGKGSDITLFGNRYGSIVVENGATVRFFQSVTGIKSLELEKAWGDTTKLEVVNANAEIRVMNDVIINSNVSINMNNNKLNFVLGNYSNVPLFVTRGSNFFVNASIYNPNGTVLIKRKFNINASFRGKIIANKIRSEAKAVEFDWNDCGPVAQPSPVAPIATVLDEDDFDGIDNNDDFFDNQTNVPTLAVVPNPSNGEFSINYNNPLFNGNNAVNITITSMQGELVKTIQFNSFEGVMSKQINLDKFADGLYFVKISNGNTQLNQKIFLTK